MTDKERKQIEKNADNPEKLDFVTAAIIEIIMDLDRVTEAKELPQLFADANNLEKNTLFKAIGILHGTISVLYEKCGGRPLTPANEMQVIQRFETLFNYVWEQQKDE